MIIIIYIFISNIFQIQFYIIVPSNVPKDVLKNVPRSVLKNDPRGLSMNVPRGVLKNDPREVSMNVPRGVSINILQEDREKNPKYTLTFTIIKQNFIIFELEIFWFIYRFIYRFHIIYSYI